MSIPEANARLLSGNVVIFPTDTVWGVGALWRNQRGVDKLYAVKQREETNPMAIVVGEIEQLEELKLDFDAMDPQMHRLMAKLVKEFWPGGLTIVLPWSHKPPFYRWSEPNIGVRIPNLPETQNFLRQVGPVIQSSANVSGGLTPTSYDAIDPDFIELTGGVLSGESGGSVASTVIDLSGTAPTIVRAGSVPVAEIERVML